MPGGAFDPIRIPAGFWNRSDTRQALQARDVGLLFRLVRRHAGASQTRISVAVAIPQGKISEITHGKRHVESLDVLERIADGLDMVDPARMAFGLAPKELSIGAAETVGTGIDELLGHTERRHDTPSAARRAASPTLQPILASSSGVISERSYPRGSDQSLAGGDDTQRRDALRFGLLASVTPEVVSRVLREAAAEAAEFTRRAESSAVGTRLLDHLEMVVSDLAGSYSRESPRELFAVAYEYRRRVEEVIRGPHTLSEARELYVYAAWLSESLAWTAHDLGSPVAADAYCIDSFEHARQAGHDELCAWAMDARASIAMYADRPQKALDSALAGISKAPDSHPIAVRLHAQAARAHAKLGHSDEFSAALGHTRRLYERLPTQSPSRHGVDSARLAAYATKSYAATSYVWLGRYAEAKISATAALEEYENASQKDRAPSREAIAKIDLAMALNGLGEFGEAAQLGVDALSSTRVVDSVVSRAEELVTAMSRSGAAAESRLLFERFRDVRASGGCRD